MRRIVVDLNHGGRLEDGRGITILVRGERRNGDVPEDARDGEQYGHNSSRVAAAVGPAEFRLQLAAEVTRLLTRETLVRRFDPSLHR